MGRVCELTGKKTSAGNNRPFSLKATKRQFAPNTFVVKRRDPRDGKIKKMRLSAKAIKTLKKHEKAYAAKKAETEAAAPKTKKKAVAKKAA